MHPQILNSKAHAMFLRIPLVAFLFVAFAQVAVGQSISETKTMKPTIELEKKIGKGSYATQLHGSFRRPQKDIFVTERVKRPIPTTDWWSSVAWEKFSFAHFPHPLAVNAEPDGLRIYYPGNAIVATQRAVIASMPHKVGDDILIGSPLVEKFEDARIDDWSDWFVRVRFTGKDETTAKTESFEMFTTYGHGSPYVYCEFSKGNAKLKIVRKPIIWHGKGTDTIGLTIGRNHYGIFGPTGSSWNLSDEKTLMNTADKKYCSVAILPDNELATLQSFAKRAHAHVSRSNFKTTYNSKDSTVSSNFAFHFDHKEAGKDETFFAIYPHQKRNLVPHKGLVENKQYKSSRGPLSLLKGDGFSTKMQFTGALPTIPVVDSDLSQSIGAAVKEQAENSKKKGYPKDTYYGGKLVAKNSWVAAIADQIGDKESAEQLRLMVQKQLEDWFSASGANLPNDRQACFFYYDSNWKTLIGYPASYDSETHLNDHHFHYGYILQAAAQIASVDPDWLSEKNYGPMVELIVRQIASLDRNDKMFPYLRCFDPYAGHSWASGNAKFHDGNNQESSSESINAWSSLILLGSAINNQEIRDLGICLYANELAAIEEYWFDIHEQTHFKEFDNSAVGIIWGGKLDYGTWFSAKSEHIHGINWLPIHAGSLYLGRFPKYAQRNYREVISRVKDRKIQWHDLMIMYRALSDPDEALAEYKKQRESLEFEQGNTRAMTETWLTMFSKFGTVDKSVVADHPLFAVLKKGEIRTYIVSNMGSKEIQVSFSDGKSVTAKPGVLTIVSSESE